MTFLRYFLATFCSELHLALLVGKVQFIVPYGEMHNFMRQGAVRGIASLSNHITPCLDEAATCALPQSDNPAFLPENI